MNTKQLYDSNNKPFYPVVNNIGGGAGEVGSNSALIKVELYNYSGSNPYLRATSIKYNGETYTSSTFRQYVLGMLEQITQNAVKLIIVADYDVDNDGDRYGFINGCLTDYYFTDTSNSVFYISNNNFPYRIEIPYSNV